MTLLSGQLAMPKVTWIEFCYYYLDKHCYSVYGNQYSKFVAASWQFKFPMLKWLLWVPFKALSQIHCLISVYFEKAGIKRLEISSSFFALHVVLQHAIYYVWHMIRTMVERVNRDIDFVHFHYY